MKNNLLELRDQGRGPWASPGPLRPTVPLRPLPYRGTKVHTMKKNLLGQSQRTIRNK